MIMSVSIHFILKSLFILTVVCEALGNIGFLKGAIQEDYDTTVVILYNTLLLCSNP